MGLHIVPAAAYDEEGVLRPAKNLLDTPIGVPVEKRTATEHAEATLQEVSRSTGIHFRGVYDFDGRYAANNYIINASFPTAHDRPYWLFAWGASQVTAREAPIDLLSGSATTLTWGLACYADFTRGGQQTCDFQVVPMVAGDNRADVNLDRCTKCRPIPK
jgi:hypothetical protein